MAGRRPRPPLAGVRDQVVTSTDWNHRSACDHLIPHSCDRAKRGPPTADESSVLIYSPSPFSCCSCGSPRFEPRSTRRMSVPGRADRARTRCARANASRASAWRPSALVGAAQPERRFARRTIVRIEFPPEAVGALRRLQRRGELPLLQLYSRHADQQIGARGRHPLLLNVAEQLRGAAEADHPRQRRRRARASSGRPRQAHGRDRHGDCAGSPIRRSPSPAIAATRRSGPAAAATCRGSSSPGDAHGPTTRSSRWPRAARDPRRRIAPAAPAPDRNSRVRAAPPAAISRQPTAGPPPPADRPPPCWPWPPAARCPICGPGLREWRIPAAPPSGRWRPHGGRARSRVSGHRSRSPAGGAPTMIHRPACCPHRTPRRLSPRRLRRSSNASSKSPTTLSA